MKDQKIELPPLPKPDGHINKVLPFGTLSVEAITIEHAAKFARAAIEPYAQRIAELEADRQRRGEPILWYRPRPGAEAHADGRCYDVVFSDPNDARFFPLYRNAPHPAEPDDRSDWCRAEGCSHKEAGSPVWETQPAEPVKEATDSLGIPKSCGKPLCAPSDHHPLCDKAEPVKAPSDEEIDAVFVPMGQTVGLTYAGIREGVRTLFDRYGQPAQPAASVRLLCRKCGEQTSISISSARLVTHFPNGMPRDARDIASDPEGKLIHEVDQDLAGYKKAPPISDAMMDLVDRLGSEYDKVDPRAWEYLLIYAPKHMLTQPAASAEPVYQFRKEHCADWYDGHPDYSDGGGPYEVRTLYSAPVAAHPTGKSPLQVAAQPSVPDDAEHMAYVASLPEVRCSKCDLLVLSSCDWQGKFSGCPVPDAYAHRRTAAPTPPAAGQAQQDADKADALLQLIDEFRERLPSSFLTLVDAARAAKEE